MTPHKKVMSGRETFEAWAFSEACYKVTDFLPWADENKNSVDKHGRYFDVKLDRLWQAWHAAQAAQREEVEELRALVERLVVTLDYAATVENGLLPRCTIKCKNVVNKALTEAQKVLNDRP